MPSTTTDRPDRREAVLVNTARAAGLILIAFLVYAGVVAFSAPRESRFDDTLPNPMGGPARTAPGDTSGEVALAGLRVEGAEVDMGPVALGVTYVPGWDITNPTSEDVTLVVGQPQVVQGCCPGPIYADGELTAADQELTVPADGAVRLQFPLQMHPGMDGPHHLMVPIAAGAAQDALHVTGDFTADATA